MDKYIGRLLDNRYEILEVIGTGGMAVVYKARCHRLNRLVAIKILKDDFLQDEEFRRRFHSESQAVAMLNHPNIVSVFDVSTSITADYIVMELIDGITLKQYMEKKGVLNWKETLHFAIQIAKALDHAHSHGIVHRDIKPHNVMVLKNGSVKVTDFGIARMMSKGNTLTKEALGSVHYISPEQAKGGRVDNRSDIYSLGVVMYEMMSGRPPYDGESPVAVAIQHINGGAAMPSTLNPNIPGGLEQIIMKAMGHEPADRYVSASKMLADLDEFRKSPAVLFDYNVPPIDAVTQMPKPHLVLEPESTTVSTAERVERRNADPGTPQRRRTAGQERRTNNNPPRRREEPKEEGRNNIAMIAIIACVAVIFMALVAVGIVFFAGGGVQQQLVEVPSLVGQEFEKLPEYEDFRIVDVDHVYDDKYLAGQIIDQTPNAGAQIQKGNVISVVVSLGKAPEAVKMPNLENQKLEDAERALDNLGLNLKYEKIEEHSNTVDAGNVIKTDPAAQTELTAGQTIKIYVSKGVEFKEAEMPDLVNSTFDLAKKTLDLQDMDLDIVKEEIHDPTVPEGEIIRTEPEAGEALKTGQTVTLYVSLGPDLKKMPNLVGMSISNAYSILDTAGFGMPTIEYVESDEDKDVVVGQSVEKDTMVDVTTEIVLQVSKGKPENPEIVMDVTIDLQGVTKDQACWVRVTRGGKVVFYEEVPQGVNTITIPQQAGSGAVKYSVVVDELDGWEVWVEFTGNG